MFLRYLSEVLVFQLSLSNIYVFLSIYTYFNNQEP